MGLRFRFSRCGRLQAVCGHNPPGKGPVVTSAWARVVHPRCPRRCVYLKIGMVYSIFLLFQSFQWFYMHLFLAF